MEDFTLTVQKLGDGSGTSVSFSPVPQVGLRSTESNRLRTVSKAVQLVSSLPGRPNIPLSVSRQANCGTPTKPPTTVSSIIHFPDTSHYPTQPLKLK